MNELPANLQNLFSRIPSIPTNPGCYLWSSINADTGEKVILYVGKANNLRSRIRQYFSSTDYKTRHLMAKVSELDYVITENELEALLLENNLIKLHSPQYNIRLKDDKRYPYLCLTTGEKFPRLIMTRKKTNPGHAYYGPYSDVTAARNIMEMIKRVFPIRKRNQALPAKSPQKPCLNYHIGRCLAPCAEKVSAEDYALMVGKIKAFLDTPDQEILSELENTMKQYAQKFEYEKAALYRNIISDIRSLYEAQSVQKDDTDNNYDVISIYGSSLLQFDEDLDLISGEDSDRDVFAAQVVLLRIRNGNLINKTSCALTETVCPDSKEEVEFMSELLESFLRDYYFSLTDIPSLVLLNQRLLPLAEWQEAINNRRQTKVRFLDDPSDPDFSSRLSLIKMAETNARLSLRERLLSEKIRNQRFGLRQIQKFLGLEHVPEVIECYDISNIQGTNAVGSKSVLKNGIPWKSAYRKYKIKTKDSPDDPAMIYEVISRRLASAREKDGGLPDLMVIDGGITQLNAAMRARQESGMNVHMVSLMKKEEIILTDSGKTVQMDKNSPGMLIVRLARDEAHRFAVSYHRKLRDKKMLTSLLDGITGIGEAKRSRIFQILMRADTESSDSASLRESLGKVRGLNEDQINLIIQRFSSLQTSG